eukprot:gene4965-8619_t
MSLSDAALGAAAAADPAAAAAAARSLFEDTILVPACDVDAAVSTCTSAVADMGSVRQLLRDPSVRVKAPM